ncbi:MAG: DUF4105 domain-containing protein [Tateyamaria sp.]
MDRPETACTTVTCRSWFISTHPANNQTTRSRFLSSNLSRVGRFLGHVVFTLIAVGFFLWSWAAFSVQLTGIFYYVSVVAVFIAVMAVFVLRRRARRLGWVGLIAIFAVLGIWYQGFEPAEDRDWAFDVAHGVQPHVDGDQITLSKVRNFEWTDETSANESWEDRSFDISKLQSVDMFTSVWDHPSIAHLLVSFGFSDGQRVVFSLETRKESHEAFNLLGGFSDNSNLSCLRRRKKTPLNCAPIIAKKMCAATRSI